MTTYLVQYQHADGRILGGWQAATEELLSAQGAETAESTSLMLESDETLTAIVDNYYVQEGQLVPKTVLTLSAVPNPFTASGPGVSVVSVAPFMPCTILVDGTPYALVAEDPTLTLSTDEPHTFVVTLAPLAAARAEPLIVEAT